MDQNNITTVHCKKFVHVSWSGIFCCGFCTSWFHPTLSGITNQGLFHPNWVYWSDCPGANEAMLTNAGRLMTWIQKSLMVLTLFAAMIMPYMTYTAHLIKYALGLFHIFFSGSFCWGEILSHWHQRSFHNLKMFGREIFQRDESGYKNGFPRIK